MIIDFHTHAFPDKIAQKTIDALKAKSLTVPFTDGTVKNLSETALSSGVNLSIVLPVITNPLSTEKINLFAAEINKSAKETGVFSFGGIHPDAPDIKNSVKRIKELGLKGLKIHPAYQQVKLNDIRYKRIIGYAEEYGLITVTHGGYDIGVDGNWSSPSMAAEICKDVSPSRFVMAHMGGWEMWEDVKRRLCGENVYFDTAFSGYNFAYMKGVPEEKKRPVLKEEDFIDIIKLHGADKILFGTDSPWGGQKEQIEFIEKLPLSDKEKSDIFYGNAAKLLQL